MLELFFQVSSYKYSKELNLIFGTTANQAYFDWFDCNHVNKDALHHWVEICTYDQKNTLEGLSHANNAQLFQTVLPVLDSYKECVIQTSPQLWEDFFQRFCLDDIYEPVEKIYAQSALFVILRSDAKFSPPFCNFSNPDEPEQPNTYLCVWPVWEKTQKVFVPLVLQQREKANHRAVCQDDSYTI